MHDRYYQKEILERVKLFVLDMDGTFYLGDRILDGSLSFLDRVMATGRRYVFFTNNSSTSKDRYIEKLSRMGVTIGENDIYTSGDVTVAYLRKTHPGKGVYLLGTPELEACFEKGGISLVKPSDKTLKGMSGTLSSDEEMPEIVVAAFDKTIDYQKLTYACTAIRGGAFFIATHPDINCPTDGGFIPDCGAICAAITLSTGVSPLILGKPYGETADYICEMTGVRREETAYVGDRLYTDVACGVNNGAMGILVLTGEAKESDIAEGSVMPDAVFESLGSIGDEL